MPIYSTSTCPAGSVVCQGSDDGTWGKRVMAAKRKIRLSHPGRGCRRTGIRPVREQVHLCVEGLSEDQYVRALLDLRYPSLFTPAFIGQKGRKQGRKTSLVNLVNAVRRAKREKPRELREVTIWIVGDVDQNDVHREYLEDWRAESKWHRSVLQAVGIEGWILQHFDKPDRCSSVSEAERILKKRWTGYVKGCEFPEWLINRTAQACGRERQFLGSRDNSGVWPVDRSSQMPALIEYLDERAARKGWKPPQV